MPTFIESFALLIRTRQRIEPCSAIADAKAIGPLGGGLCAALLLASMASPAAAQSTLGWTSANSGLGALQAPAVDAGAPIGARALASGLRGPSVMAPAPTTGATKNGLSTAETGAGKYLRSGDMVTGATTLSLLPAIQAAVAWHPGIASAASSLAQQGSTVNVARAGYMPALQAGVNVGRQSSVVTGPVATVGASQMLYDFGKVRSAVSEAEAGVQKARAEVLKQIDSVASQTALAVVEVNRYQALEEIANEQIEALKGVMRITDLRSQMGASTRVDPVQSRARLESAQAYLFQVQAQMRQWRSRLATLVGAAVPERIAPLPDDGLMTAFSDAYVDRLVPAVLAAEADRVAQEARVDSARAHKLPTVSLQASTNRYLNGAVNGSNGYQTLFVMLSSGTFQGDSLANQEKAAMQGLLAAQARVDAVRLEVQDQVQALKEQVNGLRLRSEPLQRSRKSIVETRALYREQYLSLGSRSALDLLNAEREIYQAAIDVTQNTFDTWTAQVNYLQASGQAREVFGLNNTRIQGLEVLP